MMMKPLSELAPDTSTPVLRIDPLFLEYMSTDTNLGSGLIDFFSGVKIAGILFEEEFV
jgi:hypothetical protein